MAALARFVIFAEQHPGARPPLPVAGGPLPKVLASVRDAGVERVEPIPGQPGTYGVMLTELVWRLGGLSPFTLLLPTLGYTQVERSEAARGPGGMLLVRPNKDLAAALRAAVACGPDPQFAAPQIGDVENGAGWAQACLTVEQTTLIAKAWDGGASTNRRILTQFVARLFGGGTARYRWTMRAVTAVLDVLAAAAAGKPHPAPDLPFDTRHALAEAALDVPTGLLSDPLLKASAELVLAVPPGLRSTVRVTGVIAGNPARGIPPAAVVEVDGQQVLASTRYRSVGTPDWHLSRDQGFHSLSPQADERWALSQPDGARPWRGQDEDVLDALRAVCRATRELAELVVTDAFDTAEFTVRAVLERLGGADWAAAVATAALDEARRYRGAGD